MQLALQWNKPATMDGIGKIDLWIVVIGVEVVLPVQWQMYNNDVRLIYNMNVPLGSLHKLLFSSKPSLVWPQGGGALNLLLIVRM